MRPSLAPILAPAAALLLLLLGGAAALWPDCIVQGEEDMGFDVIKGHRYSAEGCAHWCNDLTGCIKWVYKEVGQLCHVKATNGLVRDASDPLLPEDRIELGINHTDPIAATTPDPGTSVFDVNLDVRLVQRVEELQKTFSGDKTCVSDIKLPWHDCAIEGETIDLAANVADGTKIGYNSPDKEHCSDDCSKDAGCAFWTYHEQAKQCTWKTTDTPTQANDNMWFGASDCSGLVDEETPAGSDPIDGDWSPWSVFVTPCIDKKTGERVDCGGGVMLRHRRCANPEPRYGGRVCPGEDYDEYPCNTHNCKLDGEFAWSEWSEPNVLCAEGTQTRTTLCGAWRRRLPPKAGRNPEDPAVNWPTCMVPRENTAPEINVAANGKSFEDCFNDCIADADCKYWTYDLEASKCTWQAILKFDDYLDTPNFITGEKFCSGTTLPAPYCGDFQTNYAGAPNVGDPATVEYMDDCAEKCADLNAADPACAADPDACPCQNWYLHVAYAGPKTCQLRGAKATPGEAGVDVAVPENWFFFGSKDCAKKSVAPAMPEDAEELGYKEVCVGDQYDDETRVNNTWSVEDCPSPCLNNGDCPQYAECIDESDDTGPKHKCKCQLGLFMEGGKCVNLPPSTPTPRPQPELKPGLKDLTNAARTATCLVLIIFLIVTLLIFACFKIFHPGRFIHMNIELSLLLAHLCLVITHSSLWENESACRNISIAMHFFFTAVFAFYVVEAVYAYSIVSYAVRKDGMLSNAGNFMAGWGVPIAVIAFTVSFEYDNYGGSYHCWLQLDTGLIYGQYLPVVILSIVTIMLVEAGGNVDDNYMRKLDGTDEICLKSAQYMLNTLFLRLMMTVISFVVGTVAEYNQSFPLYLAFAVTNAILGGVIFVTHCFCNEVIRAKLQPIFGKWCCCCPTPEDDDPEDPVEDENNTLVEDVEEEENTNEDEENEEEEEHEEEEEEEEESPEEQADEENEEEEEGGGDDGDEEEGGGEDDGE